MNYLFKIITHLLLFSTLLFPNFVIGQGSSNRLKAKADSLFRLIPKVDKAKKDSIYRDLLNNYVRIGSLRAKIGRTAYDYGEAIGDEDLKALAAIKISIGLIHDGHFEEAETKLKAAKDYYEVQLDKKWYVTSLILLGYRYHRQQSTTEALKYYLEAIPLAEEIGDIKRINNLYNRISNLYMAKGEYAQVMKIAKKIQRNCAVKSAHCPFYINTIESLGRCHYYQGNIDSARYYILKYYDYYQSVKNKGVPDIQQTCYSLLGDLRRAEGNIEAAIVYTDSALQIAKLNNRKLGVVTQQDRLVELNRINGNTSQQIFYLENQLTAAKEYGFLGHQRAALNGLWNLYTKLDQPKNALIYANQWRIINDSLREIERKNLVKRQDELMAEQTKEQKLQMLEQSQIKHQNRNFLLLASTLFLLALLGLTIYILTLRRRLNEKLAQKNTLLNASLQERDTLLKEIHHRVKNNLQIISSLLNVQMRHVKNKEAKEALSEGRNRVRSIALIHQNLYQDSNFRHIKTEKYIESLLENIQATFRHQKILLKAEVEDILLPEEVMTQIGLVINEAVTNAYKHAFTKDPEGTILLQLFKSETTLDLLVQDNGKGISPELDLEQSPSFGLQLIDDFATKLGADYSLKSNPPGTLLHLSIPLQKIKNVKK